MGWGRGTRNESGHGLRKSGLVSLGEAACQQVLTSSHQPGNPLSSPKHTCLSTRKMFPQRFSQLRTKNVNQVQLFVMFFGFLQVRPQKHRVELPDMMAFKSPQSLTVGLEGTSCTRGSRGHRQMGPTCLHRHPIGQLMILPSQTGLSVRKALLPEGGQCTSTGKWEGVSERGSWANGLVGASPKYRHAQSLMLPPAKAGDTHSLIVCPQDKPGDLKNRSILDPSEQQSI